MTRRPPPRPSLRPPAGNGLRRHHAWLAIAWLTSVLLAALIAGAVAWRNTPAAQREREFATLETQIGTLKQQLANAQRDQQVTDIATRSLRATLTEREEEIAGLRADLEFYSRLVGGDAQREGLKVHDIHLQPLPGSLGWNLSLSLTQNAKRDADIGGTVTVSVEGVRAGKVVQLDWPALGDTTQEDGLPFHFKYFQALHATFVLPADFRPTRLQVHVAPKGEAPVERSIAWADALTGAPAAPPA
jgi:hypothetical protein